MKTESAILKSLLLIILFVFSSLNFVKAQDSFEGKVKFKMTTPQGEMDMIYFSKGKKIRVNVEGQAMQGNKMSMILSGSNMTMLMPSQKMYMQFPADFMEKKQEEEREESGDDIKPEDFPKYKTGKTKVISGYNCDQYKFNDKEEEVEVWATSEMGSFFFLQNPMSSEGGVQSLFNGSGFFPLLVISKDKDTGDEFKMEATSIEKMSVSDDMFSVPSGYKKFDMGQFNKQ